MTVFGSNVNLFVVIPGVVVTLLALLFVFITRSVNKADAQQTMWREKGQSAQAKVVSLGQSFPTRAGNLVVDITFEVHLPNAAPYRTTNSWQVSLAYTPQIQPGQVIDVRIAPTDPQIVVPMVDWAKYMDKVRP